MGRAGGKTVEQHYDPAYLRSTASNFPRLSGARVLHLEKLDDATLRAAASEAL
jgi:hypothetical protein